MVDSFQEIDKKTFSIRRIEGDIIEVTIKGDTQLNIEDVNEMRACLSSITKTPENEKMLVISGEFSTIEREAREFSMKNRVPFKAEAIVAHQLYQIIIVNFILKMTKKMDPKQNLKLFKKREDALDWLNSIG